MEEKSMKKIAIVLVAYALAMAFLVGVATTASAEDKIVEATVSRKIEKLDRNGNPICLLFVAQEHTLQGVSYTKDVMASCFGAVVPKCAAVAEGETVRMIVSPQQYQGSETFLVRHVIQ